MRIDLIHTRLRKAMRAKRNGAVTGVYSNKHRPKLTARVMSNIAKPWWGNAGMTINIGKE